MNKNINNMLAYLKSHLDQVLLQALVLALPFERIPSLDIAFITLRPSLFIGGLLILRALWLISTKSKSIKLPLEVTFIGLFLFWMFLLIPASINIFRASQVFIFTSFTVCVALSVFYLWHDINAHSRRNIVLALYVGAVITSLFGLYQYFGDFFGLNSSMSGLAERYSWKIFGFARVQSTGLEPLYFGSYLLLPTLILMSEILYRDKTIKYSVPILTLFVATLGLTLSRGAIYGLIGATMLTLVFCVFYRKSTYKNRVRNILFAVMLGFVLSLMCVQFFNRTPQAEGPAEGKKAAGAYVQQLTNSGVEGGGDDRSRFRNQAIKMVTSDIGIFMFGIGPGQFGPYIQGENVRGGWAIVNNLPLEIFLETGLIGFLLVLAVFGLIIKGSLKVQEKADNDTRYLILGLLMYIFSQAIQAQTFSTLYIMHIWVAIGLLLGVVIRTKND